MTEKNINRAGDVVYMVDTLGDPIRTISISIAAYAPMRKSTMKLRLSDVMDRVFEAIDNIYLHGNIKDSDEGSTCN